MNYRSQNVLMFTLLLIAFIFLGFNSDKPIENKEWKLVTSGLDFPEGPAWDGNKTLYASNCYGSWITRVTDGRFDTLKLESSSAIGKTNGLTFSKDGNIIACDYGIGAILSISPSGKVDTLIDGYKGVKLNRPNDLIIDKNGNLYFSDPKSYGKDKLDGRLFHYNFKTSKLTLLVDSLAFPNGINISPNGKLYLSESAKNQILSFDILDNGTVANKSVFVTLPNGDPDGLDFDSAGNLYAAHYGTGTLFIISPNGKILEEIKTPGKKPTNIEFGGDDLKTLYLTEVETNSIYKIRTNIKGYKN